MLPPPFAADERHYADATPVAFSRYDADYARFRLRLMAEDRGGGVGAVRAREVRRYA